MANIPETDHSANAAVAILGESVIAVYGSTDATFNCPQSIDVAGPNSITFCKKTDETGLARISASKAAVIICGDIDRLPHTATLIATSDPRKAFIKVVGQLFKPRLKTGVHPSAVIDSGAEIDPTAFIGPGAVIGKCSIGAATQIHANVTLYDGTRIGNNVTVLSGSSIGGDGFGFERGSDGVLERFIHLGGVLIEDDVEIGSNTSVDRGTLGDTLIRRGAKIDNQVHIAHNCDVGEDAVIIAQAMIGGSVRIGCRAWIAPGAVLMNGITIGADAVCGLGSVVTKSVGEKEVVLGNPARQLIEARALLSVQKKLISGEMQ